MQLPGSTLASRNCCRLSALASSMTPSRARPRPLGGVEFYGCCEQHLAWRTAPRYAWFRAAQEGLIDLHIVGEPVPSWAHHDRPVAVLHRQALPVLVEPGTQLCVGVRVVLTSEQRHGRILRQRDGDPTLAYSSEAATPVIRAYNFLYVTRGAPMRTMTYSESRAKYAETLNAVVD